MAQNTEDYFGLTLNDNQKGRLAALMQRRITASRYVSIPILSRLGMLEQVQGMAEKIGL